MARHVIVVPCYNEEKRLRTDEFIAYAREHDDIGLLFVDDGSTDGTRGVLEAMQGEAPARIDVLILEQNGGKAEAVRRVHTAVNDRVRGRARIVLKGGAGTATLAVPEGSRVRRMRILAHAVSGPRVHQGSSSIR